MKNQSPLKLIEKCHAPEYGMLYELNQEIPEEDFEKVKPYMQKFSPATFEDIMQISGNPNGWMCTRENAPLVEKALNITETLDKIDEDRLKQRQEFDKNRTVKEEAQLELEDIFFSASRPKQKLSNLLKAAQTVYDPTNSFRDNNYYGGGHLFIIMKKSIWYVMNNGREENNWNMNNIEIDEAGGAIGFKIPYDEHVHDLIKIVSEENEYTGDTYKEELAGGNGGSCGI
ncbi:MAG: hypothetical protein BZ138_01300 [Methanosphaera sp. rholeuAM270]|nr:MAG: hypothetical protein BZ138_01300 [Methanosphaera sp. rholeuAM270]